MQESRLRRISARRMQACIVVWIYTYGLEWQS